MVKKVFLHLGMSKAGSSSIQATLYNNSAALEKNGFRYLTEWDENHLIILKYLFSEYPVSPPDTGFLGTHSARRKRQTKDNIKTMLNVMNTTQCEALILSGEHFHELYLDSTLEKIKRFIQKYFTDNNVQAKIILIVRNPVDWLLSSLQERTFKIGYMNKNCDFFEDIIKQYKGIINLHRYFSESLILLKFEDACHDKHGLVGHLLKTMNFPEEEINNIIMHRTNESRCFEVMEFVYYVEAIEPRHPFNNYIKSNPHRFRGDFLCLKDIKGVKFDLPFQGKTELFARFNETIHLLKTNTGIDYTNFVISTSSNHETYSQETIQGFIDAFPKLSIILQKHFLKFFEKKYMETTQEKFKQLFFQNSVPWKLYNAKNIFLNLLILRFFYIYQKTRKEIGEIIPRSAKSVLKKVLR